ncbi:MAG: L,D-transpeptidase family protein [Acidobacteria bacterium]|nr:L,D-transpeptidase family protein [Acidobacteriota bacterium]
MPRFRLFLALGPILGILVACAALLVLAAGRPSSRPFVPAVDGAVEGALGLEGEAVDLGAREALRSRLLAARTAEAGVEAGSWKLWTSSERADRAWQRAALGAWHHRREVQRRQRELEVGWEAARARAEGLIGEARTRGSRLGGRSALAALRAAESSLSLAYRWAEQGRLEPAAAAAEESVAHLERYDAAWDKAHSRFEDPANRRRWSDWVTATLDRSRRERSVVLVVDKLARRLEVYDRGRRVVAFEAELGSGGLQAKLRAGDRATPEGRYKVTEKRDRGATRYHKALMLDYPNDDDRARFRAAQRRGELAAGARIGGLIEIHGRGGQGLDWTDGCVALADGDMDRLFALVKKGTPVTIVGTVP